MHADYFIYKRKSKKFGHIFYFKFYLEDGTLSKGKSTSCTNLEDAKAFCDRLMELKKPRNKTDFFTTYADDFFNTGSLWVRDRKLTREITESTRKRHEQKLKYQIMPFFRGYRMDEMTVTAVKKFRLFLIEKGELSRKTINDVLSTLKLILDSALEDGIMEKNPCKTLVPLKSHSRTRNCFTLEEACKILDRKNWVNETAWLFNVVACVTGLRKGEIYRVRPAVIKKGYMDIVDQMYYKKIMPLKTKEPRKVPICPLLQELIGKTDFSVMGCTTMNEGLRRSIKINGMTDYARGKNICFHSWRHFFNTYMLSMDMNPLKVASVMGHSTGVSSMQQRYLNFKVEDYSAIIGQQQILLEKLLGGGLQPVRKQPDA